MKERIPSALAGERLDRALSLLTGRPRAEIAELIAAGGVRVGGRAVTTRSRKLQEDEIVEADLPDVVDPRPLPDADVTFEVVHDDQHVVVVDKQPGLVVHPGSGNPVGTLVNGLLARYPEIAAVGDPSRPGIVHRLDRGTSGLLVVARTPEAHAALVAQLQARTAERRYRTLCWGHVQSPSGVIDAPIGRSDREPTKMAVNARGKPARTRYEVQARFDSPGATTELLCRLETGRTHQIRVHLSAIGHAVVGDARYGGGRALLACPRPFLHAEVLSFEHPGTGERVTFESPLPADLEAVRHRLA